MRKGNRKEAVSPSISGVAEKKHRSVGEWDLRGFPLAQLKHLVPFHVLKTSVSRGKKHHALKTHSYPISLYHICFKLKLPKHLPCFRKDSWGLLKRDSWKGLERFSRVAVGGVSKENCVISGLSGQIASS